MSEANKDDAAGSDAPAKQEPVNEMMRYRVKLQKYLQNETERTEKSAEEVVTLLKELKEKKVEFEDLKTSKVGKVVKKLVTLGGQVGDLSNELINEWKQMLDIVSQ